MSDVILKLENVCKNFRSHWTFRPIQAVKDVSLEVFRGESFGFLGHNGAGKTTTMKCIVGLIHKTSGNIFIDGELTTGPEQRRSLGYLPEQPYFYDHLTVFETVDFFAALHGIPREERRRRVAATLERVGIADRAKSSVRSLSKGLQQRVGVAQAIVNQPKLLLLDEPFSGLDPIGRLELRNLILDLKREGTTLFLSSHILSDVEDICDRVSIMAKGDVKANFHLKDSSKLFGEQFQVDLAFDRARWDLVDGFKGICADASVVDAVDYRYLTLRFSDYETARACVEQALLAGARLEGFASCGLNLEDVFMAFTRGTQPGANGTSNPSSKEWRPAH